MAVQKVKYVMHGPHKGKDFTPRNHPSFEFEAGELEKVVDVASIASLDKILAGYGAYRDGQAPETAEAPTEPAKTTEPAKDKPLTAAQKRKAKKEADEAAAAAKKEVDDAKKKDKGADGGDVSQAGTGDSSGDTADGGSDDNADAGSAGGTTSESDGTGTANEEEMI